VLPKREGFSRQAASGAGEKGEKSGRCPCLPFAKGPIIPL
jgi:hypothetical protein